MLLLLLSLNNYRILEPRNEREVRIEINDNGEWDYVGKDYTGFNC